ncbi:sugar ABC transporter permease [Paenibacillus sp. FSL H7-0716]|nr:sugar ABC transporter permease [Paenibacillus odorifer]
MLWRWAFIPRRNSRSSWIRPLKKTRRNISNSRIAPTASREPGASSWHLFRSIKMPLIKPVLMVSIIMATTGALKGFDIPYLMTNGGPGRVTELLPTYIYKTAFSSLDFGYGSAMAVCIVIESLIAVAFIRRMMDSKET